MSLFKPGLELRNLIFKSFSSFSRYEQNADWISIKRDISMTWTARGGGGGGGPPPPPPPPRYNEAQKVIGSRGGSKTPATPKMEFFVTLVDGWRPQTNYTTETFILVVAMVLDT